MEDIEEEEPPGRTPFFRAANLEKALHLKKIFVKFEGAGITGTQKDRISRLHVMKAKEQGFDTVALATCGNYGASISYYAGQYGMKSVVAIPDYYSGERNGEIISNGGQVLEMDGRYEDIVEYMRDRSNDEGWYDSSPGSRNSFLDIRGYESIAFEIFDQLGHVPTYVSVPLGNGTTLAGISTGFEKLISRGVSGKMPKFIGSSTPNGNPIVATWKKKGRKLIELNPSTIRETKASEPLVAYRSYDGQKALDAIYRSNGMAAYVTDDEMYRYSRLIEQSETLSVLPASASSLAAAHRLVGSRKEPDDIVVVLTGRSGVWTTQ